MQSQMEIVTTRESSVLCWTKGCRCCPSRHGPQNQRADLRPCVCPGGRKIYHSVSLTRSHINLLTCPLRALGGSAFDDNQDIPRQHCCPKRGYGQGSCCVHASRMVSQSQSPSRVEQTKVEHWETSKPEALPNPPHIVLLLLGLL